MWLNGETKNVIFLVLFCFLSFFSGCGSNKKIKPVNSDTVILAFGDSITAGTGANKNESYPDFLEEILNCKVINSGVPGETSEGGLHRINSDLNKFNPDLVILCHGGNDFLKNNDETEVTFNLEQMILSIQESGADAVLIGVPKPGLFLKVPAFYKELSNKYDVPLQSKIIKEILSSPV